MAAKKRTAKRTAKRTVKRGHERAVNRGPKGLGSPLAALRAVCLALPDAKEVPAWGTSTFRCGKIFAMYADPNDHHGGGRPGVWLKAAPGVQGYMIRDRPDRFFKPPYVGPSGWVGVWLDKRPDWGEIAELVEDSWKLIAPKRLVAARRA